VTVGVTVGVGVDVGVTVSVGVRVDVTVRVAVAVEVTVGVGVRVAVTVGVGVDVAVIVGVGVRVGVTVGVDVGVGAGVGVDVNVLVVVGVTVGVTVEVGANVGVLVAVGVVGGVLVAVGVTVEVGVRLGVAVDVAVRVGVGVRVNVGVLVGVAVEVGVRVGVGVGVRARIDNVAVAADCCLIAEIVALDVPAEAGVVIVNEADVEPGGTVTLAGTVAAAVFELTRYTSSPPAGAAALIVTVPVEGVPATTVVGLRPRLLGRGEVAVRVPVAAAVVEAVTTVLTSSGTAAVAAANVAVLAPAATFTDAGTETTDEDAARDTTVPPAGAGPLKVTVPVAEPPPATDTGEKTTLSGTGAAVSERAILGVAPPYAAEIVTEEPVPVMRVVTVNVADREPAATATLTGTVAFAVLELFRVTVAPPVGAGAFRVTVAVGLCPCGTLVRSSVTENALRVATTV
jgi:hypothetical protein